MYQAIQTHLHIALRSEAFSDDIYFFQLILIHQINFYPSLISIKDNLRHLNLCLDFEIDHLCGNEYFMSFFLSRKLGEIRQNMLSQRINSNKAQKQRNRLF